MHHPTGGRAKRGPSHWARRALEAPGFRHQRTTFAGREIRREQKFVEGVATSYGVATLDDEFYRSAAPTREESVFFILGSGASVERLSQSNFAVIADNFSIGINAWALHSFVPNAYAFEPVPSRESDHFRTMAILDRPEVGEKCPFILFLRPRSTIEGEQVAQIPRGLRAGTLFYGRVTPFTRETANLAGDIDSLMGYFDQHHAPSVMLDSGASIVRMTTLGVRLGYRTIVYVGVDLNNSEYFWQRNPAYLARLGLESFDSGQKTSVHETMSPLNRPFVVTDMIRGFSDSAQIGAEVSFFSGSAESALNDFLPLYPWRRGS